MTEDDILSILHEQAISHDDEGAQYILGDACLYGLNMRRDYNAAIDYFTRSIRHGNKYALFALETICLYRNLQFKDWIPTLGILLHSQNILPIPNWLRFIEKASEPDWLQEKLLPEPNCVQFREVAPF